MELKIQSLSKRYPNGVQALKNVNLTISAGMFGLLGPNGAGKSTLMRILATLQEADSGSATLDGLDLLKEKEEVRKILGYLPQEFGLYPHVTALEMLDHLALLKGIRRSKPRRELVQALLKRTNLYEARGRNLSTFSGGMKQRFGIAQALIGNPKLIIVDEPTAGLDPEERIRFQNLLSDISEQVVIILSTHIVSDVSDLCNQMAILLDGQVIFSGQPLPLVEVMRGRVWRRLIDKSELAGYEDQYEVICTRKLSGKVLLYVHSRQHLDDGFAQVEPDLADVYFYAMRRHGHQPDLGRPSLRQVG
jgi:ABC-type multidrug transport system ATPase subunit